FFFQAEDGIRDRTVTGVQTCALPIYRGYVSDITRTYPASGAFTPEQGELYALVRAAGTAALARCTPGTEWRDVHRTAALVIAERSEERRVGKEGTSWGGREAAREGER